MLIELLNTSNYVSYNTTVANILGLHASIYISEILSINTKAIKKKMIDDKVFKIDRDYIKSRTTFDESEQLEIENNLLKIGLLEKPTEDKNCIKLNINVLTTLVMSEDEELISNITKLTKVKTTKATKGEKIKEELKQNIVTTNEELRAAYFSWIDTVYAKQGWLSKKSVVAAQQIVDNFSQRDLDIALKLIEIADTNGYRHMEWAVNMYKKNYSVTYRVPRVTAAVNNQSTILSDEVF